MEIKLYQNNLHDIHTILNTYKDHPVVKEMLARKDVCVYDLGCGLPDFLYCMFHLYDCIIEIVGVEQAWVDINTQTKGTGISMFDLYKYTLNENRTWLQAPSKTVLNVDDYVKHFNLLYQHDIYSFFEKLQYKNKQCDYLILSNIIHLMKNEPTFFEDSIAKLKTGGLIYARVNHQLNKNSIKNDHLPFSEECYIDLFKNSGFELIDYSLFEYPKEDENGNVIEVKTPTKKEGILFFGVKR